MVGMAVLLVRGDPRRLAATDLNFLGPQRRPRASNKLIAAALLAPFSPDLRWQPRSGALKTSGLATGGGSVWVGGVGERRRIPR